MLFSLGSKLYSMLFLIRRETPALLIVRQFYVMHQCAPEIARNGSQRFHRCLMRRKSSKLLLFMGDSEWENVGPDCRQGKLKMPF